MPHNYETIYFSSSTVGRTPEQSRYVAPYTNVWQLARTESALQQSERERDAALDKWVCAHCAGTQAGF